MRNVRLVDWQPRDGEERIAQTVFVDGRPILKEGAKLTPQMVKRLRSKGITSVFVRDSIDELITPEDQRSIVSEKTRAEAVRALKESKDALKTGASVNAAQLNRTANAVIEDVLANRSVLLQFSRIRSYDDYLVDHSISVCVLAVHLASHMGISPTEYNVLAVGALLHDVGTVFIPSEILMKSARLSTSEMERVQSHAKLGFEHLRKQRDISLLSAHVAYQHHERLDGSGYPRGLSGEEIHRYAKIVAVADMFDAMTTDRPHRPKWAFPKALAYLTALSDQAVDEATVRTLVSRVAPYPVGSCVMLNTSEIGVVVKQNANAPASPIIKLVGAPRSGALVYDMVDLSEDKTRRIVDAVDASVVRALLKS